MMWFVPALNQIALSVVDLRVTDRWFREGLGLLPAGGNRAMMRGLLPSLVQGLPRAASTCWWLVGRNPWFQIEMFQFERPLARLLPHDFRSCDIGYTRIGFWVADFDAALRRLRRLGSKPMTDPIGERGRRRACVRNPDGVYVEIMEDDPLPMAAPKRSQCPTSIRTVTLSVPDLDASANFFRDVIGLEESKTSLHTPEHEALWELAGATSRHRLFESRDALVEIVQYVDPVGRPWPDDYRISDQGILNIAFGAHSKSDFNEVYERARDAGARRNCRPIHLPGAGVVYVNDAQGFSVELLWLKPGKGDLRWGFEPRPAGKRPAPDTHSVKRTVRINAPIDNVWAVVSDHERMADWSGLAPVTLIEDGAPERNGYGAVRRTKGRTGAIVEQITDWKPLHGLRYRVIKGSPFDCHQGKIRLKDLGAETELTWTIRFRPKLRGSGPVLRMMVGRLLRDALDRRLKPLIERA
ncbi:MAG: SRPBCC family protein [Betaproteobacteria bacterium]